MPSFSVDRRDQDFVLYEMLKVQDLLKTELFQDYDQEVFTMALDLAAKVSREAVWPTFAPGDREGAVLQDGQVKVPKGYHALNQVFQESGLSILHVPTALGGQGLPLLLDTATREHYIYNMGFNLYTEATVGAANLIAAHGSEQQQRTYMEKMYAGTWGGTMVLTEPGAGTDVGALTTKAVKQADGSYRIAGAKIFISGGDSDLYSNIVHPVLARIEGDPGGSEGLSLFLVPKFLVNADGSLGRRNDFAVAGIEHKLGLKGSATCAMSFGEHGDCYGELLGAPRQGLRIMFQMMNEARIGMGVQAVGTASMAYLQALNYAKQRLQSSEAKQAKDPLAPKVAIIRHPDVRRMLLTMKTQVEGMRALVYFCSIADDKAHAFSGAEAETWRGLRDLLIPLVKAYCTDTAFQVTDMALQTHGGYGYTQDYPVEQLLRDMKIGSIYEGTNGVQALDLIGRKLGMQKGAAFKALLQMMQETVKTAAAQPALAELAKAVGDQVHNLGSCAAYFATCAAQPETQVIPLVKAYPFLNLFGTVALGWLHLWAAVLAEPKSHTAGADQVYYRGKVQGATFYIKNLLPAAKMCGDVIKNGDLSVVEMDEAAFAT